MYRKIVVKIRITCSSYKGKIMKHAIYIKNMFLFMLHKKRWGLYVGEARNEEVIISLTSFPARIDRVHLCLKALLMQSIKPDRIVLYLGEDEFKDIDIPQEIDCLRKWGIEVRFRKDLKPHTKYYYAMQEFPDAIIITVDDDCYYHKNLVRDLLKAHSQYPKEVICTRAHKMVFENGKVLSYNKWDYETTYLGEPSHLLFATGVGGVLYPPNCLPKETFNEKEILRLCINADDVWLKAMEILANIKVYKISASKTKYVVGIVGAEKVALAHSNVLQNGNDKYIDCVFKEYDVFSTLDVLGKGEE